jgi:23S rRNA (guanosine2251-2'-O)-methyltransferase
MEILFRRNPVLEALRGSRRHLHRLWLDPELPRQESRPFLELAKGRGVPVESADRQKLGNLTRDKGHQGVALESGPYRYATLEESLALAHERGEAPLLLVLDLVQGPQNVGMLLRSAEAFGVHGVLMQERRAPDITPAMAIASAGATEHLLISQVPNLNNILRTLKQRDIWVAGAALDPTAEQLGQVDLNRPIALVIGHEGSGLRHQVQQNCDFLITIPMVGQVESLNAAVSGSILLHAARAARAHYTQKF